MSRSNMRTMPQNFKWVSSLCARDCCISSNSYYHVTGPRHVLELLRFTSTESAFNLKNGGNLDELAKNSPSVRKEAEAALLDYFHSTRSFHIMDAENMSKNTPNFFDKLLKRVDVGDAKVGQLLSRFLRYHPVNEFEPFFESIGLKPSEYVSFIPHNLMFLHDEELLLENYHALCNYGIPRNRIGKIYKDARDVFGYGYGVLLSKLQTFQKFGLKTSLIAKIIASSPHLLIGDMDCDFVEFLEKLKNAGVGFDWLEDHISVEESYDWKCMLKLTRCIRNFGLSEDQSWHILASHPDILLESSGRFVFFLFGLLLKFGHTPTSIRSVLLEFPHTPLKKFVHNFFRCHEFLVEINMDAQDIRRICCSHATVMGSCEVKKAKTLLNQLNCGQASLCQLVKDDPCVLRKWALGLPLAPLQMHKRVVNVNERKAKTEFLSSLGFVENSKEMEKALEKFRGRGSELHERFDCLVETGLRREEVVRMIKSSPQILTQTSNVMRRKVEFFVKELGYKASDLVAYPKLMSYTISRVKLRLLMYKWLKGEGAVRSNLTFATLLSCSEENFVRSYVNSHPRGQECWKRLKENVCSD